MPYPVRATLSALDLEAIKYPAAWHVWDVFICLHKCFHQCKLECSKMVTGTKCEGDVCGRVGGGGDSCDLSCAHGSLHANVG